MPTRRAFTSSLLASAALPSALPPAYAQAPAPRPAGLPKLTITGAKIIATSGGSNYRWIFLKLLTSEPGLYGIGSASNHYQTHAVIAALQHHLIPWLIGKDASQIEDLWQSSHLRTYWRNGPVNNNVLSALDMALWDIKGKRAGMPVFDLLGGKVRDAVPCYDHVGGRDAAEASDNVLKSQASGYRHIRVQFGGYGGGGFIPAGQGSRATGGYAGPAFDEELYVDQVPKMFEQIRAKVGFAPKLCHDVHSHLTGMNAAEFSRRMQPLQMFFVEDVLPPEQLAWYRELRKLSTTPQAVGELFTHPFEYMPFLAERLIDFARCRVSSIGGITPAKKVAVMCEINGCKTAFQEGGENDPINQLAAYHVDMSSPGFGIQEENHFPDFVHELLPGAATLRAGYLYGTNTPGLGIDINESLAAKHPLKPIPDGGPYRLDRAMDGSVVKP
ncbi:MAG: mandelate racemase [Acidobacteria bacterium]|nr:mandelate racemase [Acidobacteriota bacterium]